MSSRFLPPILLAIAPVVLQAQQADSTRLPRVVVTATRTDRAHGSAVATTTVLDARALGERGVADVTEALRLVPGLHLVRSGGPGTQVSLFMRGAESDHVRLLVDGVPVNEPGGAVDLSAWTLGGLDRIEVVRGPASVLYGSDAVAGVVQLFTRRPASSQDATLHLASGTLGTRHVDATAGMRRATLDASLGASRRQSSGIHAFNSAWWNEAAHARLRWSPHASTITVTGQQRRDELHVPTDGAGRVVDVNAFRAGRRSSLGVDVTHTFGPRLRLAASMAALEGRGTTDDRADSPSDTLGLHTYLNRGAVRRRAVEARAEGLVTPGILATAGVTWEAEAQRSRDSSNYGGSPAFAARRETRAAFAQVAGGTGDLQYMVGVRHDDNSVFGGFTTARAGGSIRLADAWRIRGSVGTSFKAPTFLEQFSTAFTTGNPDLSPERGGVAEGGVAWTAGAGRGEVSATGFAQRFTNLIQYAWRETGPHFFNVARAASRGVELDATWVVARGIRATGNTTWLRTRVLDAGFDSGPGATFVAGQRLLRRPGVTSSVALVATRWPRVALDATILRIGTRDDRDFRTFPAKAVRLPAWTRIDAGAQLRVRSDLMLTARMENLVGARYEEVYGFRAPGRLAVLGLRLEHRGSGDAARR